MSTVKQPTKRTNYDVATAENQISLTFDNELHLKNWMQEAADIAYAKAKLSALKDLQESARLLVKDIFGVELRTEK